MNNNILSMERSTIALALVAMAMHIGSSMSEFLPATYSYLLMGIFFLTIWWVTKWGFISGMWVIFTFCLAGIANREPTELSDALYTAASYLTVILMSGLILYRLEKTNKQRRLNIYVYEDGKPDEV
jgi:FtsH-binding integral membrane protein